MRYSAEAISPAVSRKGNRSVTGILRRCGGSLEHAYRENHGIQSGKLHAALELKRSFIMQQALIPSFLLEDQFPDKEDCPWMLFGDFNTYPLRFRQELRTHAHPVNGWISHFGGEVNVLFERVLCLPLSLVHPTSCPGHRNQSSSACSHYRSRRNTNLRNIRESVGKCRHQVTKAPSVKALLFQSSFFETWCLVPKGPLRGWQKEGFRLCFQQVFRCQRWRVRPVFGNKQSNPCEFPQG